MTVVLTGRSLTLDGAVGIARGRVEVSAKSLRGHARGPGVIEEVVAAGTAAYGGPTGVGMRRDARVESDDLAAFNRSVIAGHRGLGT